MFLMPEQLASIQLRARTPFEAYLDALSVNKEIANCHCHIACSCIA